MTEQITVAPRDPVPRRTRRRVLGTGAVVIVLHNGTSDDVVLQEVTLADNAQTGPSPCRLL